MEDVLDVYARPYDPTMPVLCIDEKSKELRSELREPIPAVVGQVRRIDSEYEREGTANIFVCVEPLAGQRTVTVTDQRCLQDFAHFLKFVSDEKYPNAKKIVMVVDNLNTHGPHALYETFPAEEAHRLANRFEWHFTPEHGSWLNVAECELSVMSRQCLNRRILGKTTLIKALTAWELARNSAESTIHWQFTTADSRIKLRRLYPMTI